MKVLFNGTKRDSRGNIQKQPKFLHHKCAVFLPISSIHYYTRKQFIVDN